MSGPALLACEEMFLLLTREDGAKEGWGTRRGLGLAAAVLADLDERGCVSVEGGWRRTVRVLPAPGTGDELLDAIRSRLAGRDGKSPKSVVRDRRLISDDEVGARLLRAEIVGHQPSRMLGIVAARWPVVDPRPEAAVRERLRRTLLGDGDGGVRDATLLGALHALGVARSVLGDTGLGRWESGTRLRRLRDSSPYAKAVHQVLQEDSSSGATGGSAATGGAV